MLVYSCAHIHKHTQELSVFDKQYHDAPIVAPLLKFLVAPDPRELVGSP